MSTLSKGWDYFPAQMKITISVFQEALEKLLESILLTSRKVHKQLFFLLTLMRGQLIVFQ